MSKWCRHFHVRPHYFILNEACSGRLELADFAGKISKNRLVCKNAVALAYYGSCRLLVMGSWYYDIYVLLYIRGLKVPLLQRTSVHLIQAVTIPWCMVAWIMVEAWFLFTEWVKTLFVPVFFLQLSLSKEPNIRVQIVAWKRIGSRLYAVIFLGVLLSIPKRSTFWIWKVYFPRVRIYGKSWSREKTNLCL